MTVKMLIILMTPFGTFRGSVSLVVKPMILMISKVRLLTATLGHICGALWYRAIFDLHFDGAMRNRVCLLFVKDPTFEFLRRELDYRKPGPTRKTHP